MSRLSLLFGSFFILIRADKRYCTAQAGVNSKSSWIFTFQRRHRTHWGLWISMPLLTPYKRIETAFLQGITGQPRFTESKVTGPKKDRVYELRSYESPTEHLYKWKCSMKVKWIFSPNSISIRCFMERWSPEQTCPIWCIWPHSQTERSVMHIGKPLEQTRIGIEWKSCLNTKISWTKTISAYYCTLPSTLISD